MRVVITGAAREDLLGIAQYSTAKHPAGARRFVRGLRASVLALGHAPAAHPVVPRYAERGVRRHVWRDYLIFFRIETGHVAVLRVIHGARDYEALMIIDDPAEK